MSYQEVAEYPALGSGKGKRYYRGARGELYPITALTPALLRARLAHVGAQAKGKEKRSEQAGATAIVRGVVVVGEEGRQPANEGEVFLVSEELDYGEYQFVKGGAFIFTEVPIGHYMLYARAGRPPENPDRPETIWAVEIKKEKRSYAVELRLRPPLGVKPRPSPEMRRPKSSEGRKGTRSQ